jgi:DNA polymerase-3 subunit beta
MVYFLEYMKFACRQKDFLMALSVAQKAVGSTGVLPVLENVLISAEGQNIEVSATNLEISITTSFSAQIQNEGKVTIPAKTLLSWVSLVSDEELEISKGDGEGIILQTKTAKTSIKGVSADEFPVLPVVEKESVVRVSQKELKRTIEEVVFSAASTGTRPVLSGVLFVAQGEELLLVGTDSYRLSEKKITLSSSVKEPVRCIIPAKTLMEIERIIGADEKEDIEIIFSKNQVLFLLNGIRIISRLIEGQFPNYEQILPKTHKNEVVIQRQNLIQTVKRVGIFARENNNNVHLVFRENELIVTTDPTEIGTEESRIEIQNTNGENSVALNAQFLLDALLVFSGKEVLIKIGEKLSPVSIISQSDSDFLHIIMPLKV